MSLPSWRQFFLCILIFSLSVAARAQDEVDRAGPLMPGVEMGERVVRLPGDRSHGRAQLEVTVMTPAGPGPFPLVIANHGATNASRGNRGERYRSTFFVLYFLSRGYAVALPMMRGFARSDGEFSQHGCDVAQVARDNADDIAAVLRGLADQPDLDTSRTVVIGQSYGGWNTLALGAIAPPNVVGLINFSGGMRTSICRNDDDGLIEGAEDFGRRTRLPSIWFYGDNDGLFPASLWHAMYDHYTAAGGKAELVAVGKIGSDSHAMSKFPETLPIWTPRLDAFLAGLGMPARMVHPDYMPKPWPKPTGYAAIDDIGALPYHAEQLAELYRKYLSKPIPKAFLISPGGFADDREGGFDPIGEGQAECRKAGKLCRVYAVDDQVVWTPFPPPPPASGYAAIDNADAVPYLNLKASDAGRELYRKYLAKTGHKALVLGPGGSAYASYDGFDAFDHALLLCQDKSLICEPYAIDDQVVWVPPPPLPAASKFADLQNVEAVPFLNADGKRGYQHSWPCRRRGRSSSRPTGPGLRPPARTWRRAWPWPGAASSTRGAPITRSTIRSSGDEGFRRPPARSSDKARPARRCAPPSVRETRPTGRYCPRAARNLGP